MTGFKIDTFGGKAPKIYARLLPNAGSVRNMAAGLSTDPLAGSPRRAGAKRATSVILPKLKSFRLTHILCSRALNN